MSDRGGTHSQQRREILNSELLKKTGDRNLSWKLSKNTMYVTFIEGDSPLESAPRIVSQLLKGIETRQKMIDAALGDRSVLSRLDYDIDTALNQYVDLGKGQLPWLLDVISFTLHRNKIVKLFGLLAKILPRVRYDEVCCARKEHVKKVGIMIDNFLFPFLTFESTTLIEASSQNGTFSAVSQYLSHRIASDAEPTYSEVVYWQLLRENCDARVAALLAYPTNCPWKTAEEAVAALREERKKRIIQIDSKLPEWYTAPVRWNLTMGVQPQTRQDEEDVILQHDGPRADYINGKLAIEKALSKLVRNALKDNLRNALRRGFLHSSLISTNRLCKEFVNSPGTTDAMEPLSRLILTLQREKSERVNLLNAVFDQARLSNPGLKTANSYVDSDLSNYGDEFNEYDFESYYETADMFDDFNYDSNSFPSSLEVCELKYRYVDLGEGLPEEILRTSVKCQRTEQLEESLGKHFEGWLPGEVERWIHSSQLCATFASRTEDGIPTDEDMDVFLKNVAQLPSAELKRVHHDTDYDVGDEWKYHMSGGDYGNDPDSDAMWNSYWDC